LIRRRLQRRPRVLESGGEVRPGLELGDPLRQLGHPGLGAGGALDLFVQPPGERRRLGHGRLGLLVRRRQIRRGGLERGARLGRFGLRSLLVRPSDLERGLRRRELLARLVERRGAELLPPANDLEVAAGDRQLLPERLHLLERRAELLLRPVELGAGLQELAREVGLVPDLAEIGIHVQHLGLGVGGSSRRFLIPVAELRHLAAEDVEVRLRGVQLTAEAFVEVPEGVPLGGDRVAFRREGIALGGRGLALGFGHPPRFEVPLRLLVLLLDGRQL
jgi:hypothetical protein